MNNLSDDDKRNNLEKKHRSQKKFIMRTVRIIFCDNSSRLCPRRSANRRWSMIKWILISSLLF